MRSLARALFFFSCGMLVLSGVLFAEVVTDVAKDGTLTLADGKRVVLVGIQMDEEGVSVLRVLAHKQDVKLQLLTHVPVDGKKSAYVYLLSKSVKHPGKPGAMPGEQEVLLNEFLLEIGAAKVAETQEFSRKAKFLKIQAEARKKGEGVWSYAVS